MSDAPEERFNVLTEMCPPADIFVLYLYSGPSSLSVQTVGAQAATALWRVTFGNSHSALCALNALIAALLYVVVTLPPRVAATIPARPFQIPPQTYGRKSLGTLWIGTMDGLRSPLAARYTWAFVERWLADGRLKVVAQRGTSRWLVILRKLSTSS